MPKTGFYSRFDRNPDAQAIFFESDLYEALDVLARQVGVRGIFSDWPESVTYYANCMGLKVYKRVRDYEITHLSHRRGGG